MKARANPRRLSFEGLGTSSAPTEETSFRLAAAVRRFAGHALELLRRAGVSGTLDLRFDPPHVRRFAELMGRVARDTAAIIVLERVPWISVGTPENSPWYEGTRIIDRRAYRDQMEVAVSLLEETLRAEAAYLSRPEIVAWRMNRTYETLPARTRDANGALRTIARVLGTLSRVPEIVHVGYVPRDVVRAIAELLLAYGFRVSSDTAKALSGRSSFVLRLRAYREIERRARLGDVAFDRALLEAEEARLEANAQERAELLEQHAGRALPQRAPKRAGRKRS